MSTVDEILAHHGIKGMKWGVRRSDPSDGSTHGKSMANLKETAKPSEDAARAAAAKAKISSGGTSTLSNKELQDVVTRMNLEQQYSRLASSPKQTSAGTTFVKGILRDIGREQLKQLGNKVIAKQVGTLMAKSAVAALV